MPRAAEMLARLNPTAVRYDIGRGGVPELTNIDIAGALGMVRDRFGRSVLEAVHWDRNAPGVLNSIRSGLMAQIAKRTAERADALRDARIRELLEEDEHEVLAARAEVMRLEAGEFPSSRDRIHAVLDLVLFELFFPNHCVTCKGRKTFRTEALVVTCSRCAGSGRHKITDAERAEMVGLSQSGYRKASDVRALYAWLVTLLQDSAGHAETQLSAALKRESA